MTLLDMLIEREELQRALVSINEGIAAALADPDTDMTGVRVTERRDIRVKVVDQDALDSYLFRTGRHKLVTSTIRLPGATEQALYDALQMVQGVVGPTGATAARTINTGSLKALLRKMRPDDVAGLAAVEVTPVVTRTAAVEVVS